MIKLLDILREIETPKGKWISIPASELDDYDEEIYSLIDNAYSDIGGHLNYKFPKDVNSSSDYEGVDLDDDPELDAVSVSKKRTGGNKLTSIGHDGTKPAKTSTLNRYTSQLKSSGYYLEAPGKIKDILLAKGVKPIDDEELVRKVLKGKDIEWLGDGTYNRMIAGKKYTKMLMGKPKI